MTQPNTYNVSTTISASDPCNTLGASNIIKSQRLMRISCTSGWNVRIPNSCIILLNEWYQINNPTSGHQCDIPYYQALLYIIFKHSCNNDTRHYTTRHVDFVKEIRMILQYISTWETIKLTLFMFTYVIVRRAGLLWSQRDFEWRWSVRLFKCLTVLEFSFILFDLCLLITFFNFIMNYVPIVTFWIFTYHKIWILSIMFCFIWSYWIIYFLACL